MTDTVNVPQEMIDAVMKVAVGVDECGSEVFAGPLVAAELVRAMLAAATKVEQDPVAWRYRMSFQSEGCWYYDKEAPEPHECGDHKVMVAEPLYTHPAPASDELLSKVIGVSEADLEALRAAANLEYYAGLDKWGEALERIYRRLSTIAKHKGPQ